MQRRLLLEERKHLLGAQHTVHLVRAVVLSEVATRRLELAVEARGHRDDAVRLRRNDATQQRRHDLLRGSSGRERGDELRKLLLHVADETTWEEEERATPDSSP